MSQITARLDLSPIRARIQRIREKLPVVVASAVEKIAHDSLEQRYFGGPKAAAQGGDRGIMHGRIKKLGAIFIPVKLKHRRREQWPDLRPIYEAMVVRGQSSYMGRRVFWVDERKLANLRRDVLRKAMKGRVARGEWKIQLRPKVGEIAVTIERRGRVSRADQKQAAELTKLMKEMFAERASAVLYQALNG